MKCLRCGGLMTCETYLIPTEMSEFELCEAWRCINCGELVDAVILSHRQHRPETLSRPARHTPASVH